MDITNIIKANIRSTADRLGDASVTTAESMIPLMERGQKRKSWIFFIRLRGMAHGLYLWRYMGERGILDKKNP